MNSSEEIAKKSAKKMFSQDSFCRRLGIELVKVSPGMAEMKMQVKENMVNGHNICHGGVIFTLADTTFAYACNSYDRITLAMGSEIEFLTSATIGDRLRALGKERKRGRSTGIYDIEVFNQEDKLIALFRGKAFVTDKKIL